MYNNLEPQLQAEHDPHRRKVQGISYGPLMWAATFFAEGGLQWCYDRASDHRAQYYPNPRGGSACMAGGYVALDCFPAA